MFDNSDAEALPDVQTQDFLPPLSSWMKFGGLFVIGTIAAAIAVSSVAQYRVTVKAPAVIRPAGELRLVQAATAGTVVQVRVTPNQIVKRGDVIAQIDDSQLQTKRSQLQNGIRQAQLQILQMQAQIQSIETRIAAERNRGDRAVAASEAEWSQRQRDYQNQQVISTTEVAEAQASLQAAQAALNMAQVRLERYRPIAAQGALERDRLAEAELATQQQAQEVAAAEAKLQRARTALNPTDASVSVAIERIAIEQATGEATLASLSQEREALIQQKIQLQNQLELDARELSQVQRELLKTTVRATANGAIAKLNLRNAGQTVQPGEEIAQIVPNATQLTIKAFVPAQEISKIRVGQSAQFRISACPYPDYGTLSGTVRTISPDAITPPAQTAQEQPAAGAPYYEVALEPESLVLSQGDRHCQIQVGMEGRIDIISSQDTVLRSILRKARLIADL
ncbi:MAG: HlyD family efflux transporter periplasmic adaptor subunit [Oscillatoriophycideae cyanobacterium NC_groundwater_1537_Pr4_S-0.65um_50_18]|nr:HlyD family efflux transporter periplasmic adaptor subunit [Oscillatoriophycideae cyanobacterium NC_groundwater_1537_Pr4_S-0.65um_50_18]